MSDQIPSSLPVNPLPGGTVTFLFTDIEGSTQLLTRLRDQYADLLAEHHRLLREVFARHHGREVDTQGDAFFVAFPRATDAVGAVVDAQRALAQHPWPGDAQVRVRMGLHTGEPLQAVEECCVIRELTPGERQQFGLQSAPAPVREPYRRRNRSCPSELEFSRSRTSSAPS